MIYRGRVKGGVVVLDDPEARISEGTAVTVAPAADEAVKAPLDPLDDPFYRIDELAVETGKPDLSARVGQIGTSDPLFTMGDLAVETGIPGLSVNIDHYLYGHPKVEDDEVR